MIREKLFFIFLFLSTIQISAQVDTNDWFPMQIGNYWEYEASTGEQTKPLIMKIIGDTIWSNGNKYMIFQTTRDYGSYIYNYYFYYRKDSDMVFSTYHMLPECKNEEYIYLKFNVEEKTYWEKSCNEVQGNARGYSKSEYNSMYYDFFKRPLETKLFEDVLVDSTRVFWTPNEASVPVWVGKGVGIIRYYMFNDADWTLSGAIIDGLQFGTITSNKDVKFEKPANINITAYPNPFNGIVTLDALLPNSDFTEINVYNILGQKIKTVLNEFKNAGKYSIKLEMDNFSSGTYFVVLRQNNLSLNSKIILLK